MILKGCLNSESGTTLVEVLTAVGLFAILAAILVVVNMTFLKGGRDVKARTARDLIISTVRLTATDKKSLILSMSKSQNSGFKNCVCGVATCTNFKQPLEDFTLYDSSNQIQSPLFYNSDGLPCDTTKSQCQLRVRTQYFAQCLPDLAAGNQNPPASCDGKSAEFMGIIYTVDENPAFNSKDSVQLRPISGPAYVQVSDIFAEACP
jgi:type II secretory pathway pseudopilin PulG